jgi:hypothetical protein
MSATAVIGFGIITWALLAVVVSLFVTHLIRIRDRQRPDDINPATVGKDKPSHSVEPFHTRHRGRLRRKS